MNVLVQLGQGDEVRAASERCLEHLSGTRRGAGRGAALASRRDRGRRRRGVVGLDSTYPMSRYLRAFDATVSAAGYNAYHELIRFGVPSLFVPMRRQTDDQHARARYAEESGVGRGVDGPADPALEAKLDELLDPAKREAMRSALREQRPGNGAAPAAEWLAGLAASERVRKPGTKRWKRYAAHPVSSARAAAPFAARLPGAVGRIAHQTATRPKARVVVDAGELRSGGRREASPGGPGGLRRGARARSRAHRTG